MIYPKLILVLLYRFLSFSFVQKVLIFLFQFN